jgi:hypothetical protein
MRIIGKLISRAENAQLEKVLDKMSREAHALDGVNRVR